MKIIGMMFILSVLLVINVPSCNMIKGMAKDTHDIAQRSQDLIEGKNK